MRNDSCGECGDPSSAAAVFPNGCAGINIVQVCEGCRVIFQHQGPRALPRIWMDAVSTLVAKLNGPYMEVQ